MIRSFPDPPLHPRVEALLAMVHDGDFPCESQFVEAAETAGVSLTQLRGWLSEQAMLEIQTRRDFIIAIARSSEPVTALIGDTQNLAATLSELAHLLPSLALNEECINSISTAIKTADNQMKQLIESLIRSEAA